MARQISAIGATRIKVIGVGGGGSNAVTRMVRENIPGVEFIALNTDSQSLQLAEAPTRRQLGDKLTRGLGAGGEPSIGCKAAMESKDDLRELCGGADIVFITAGMGGGTGTGAAPVVAELVKESGALTVAVVTKPFSFEGAHRRLQAEAGLAKLVPHVDTLITISNDGLLRLCDANTGVDSAFKLSDDILKQAVESIVSVVTVPGLINLDFADVRSVLKGAGLAQLSIGKGTGANRATDAAKAALASPLLDIPLRGAKRVLYNICGNNDLTLTEVQGAADVIAREADPAANIIFGVVFDAKKHEEVTVTLVATGLSTGARPTPSLESVRRLMNNMDTSPALDAPAFMRQSSAGGGLGSSNIQGLRRPRG
ncbi:MAG: cell division protein FtsZ [Chloroflexi bacterium]|nr:cell division protein FtsZ [Chloroflexota bacterium]